jgi:hypothetical protein
VNWLRTIIGIVETHCVTLLRAMLTASLMLVAVARNVVAGPLEDARAAYQSADYATAYRLFRPLANQGNATAQTNLGVMYGDGQGVPQNYTEALNWFRKAADQGDAGAQYNLGIMYRDGRGVQRNYVLAHMWLNLAASRFPDSKKENRDSAIEARDLIATKMTATQTAKAQKLAREWSPKIAATPPETSPEWWQRVLESFR